MYIYIYSYISVVCVYVCSNSFGVCILILSLCLESTCVSVVFVGGCLWLLLCHVGVPVHTCAAVPISMFLCFIVFCMFGAL